MSISHTCVWHMCLSLYQPAIWIRIPLGIIMIIILLMSSIISYFINHSISWFTWNNNDNYIVYSEWLMSLIISYFINHSISWLNSNNNNDIVYSKWLMSSIISYSVNYLINWFNNNSNNDNTCLLYYILIIIKNGFRRWPIEKIVL